MSQLGQQALGKSVLEWRLFLIFQIFPPKVYVCAYVSSHIYSKSVDQPGKVANPARGQLNRENAYFPVPVRA